MIHYLDKYLSSACTEPGFVYGTRDKSVNRRDNYLCPSRTSVPIEGNEHSTTGMANAWRIKYIRKE